MKTLLELVSASYGLRSIACLEKVTKGFLSDNVILSDHNTKYFLKKYCFTDEQRVAQAHAAKMFFSEGGVPVIMPLTTRDNRTYFSHDGGLYVLFPFVQAHQYERGFLPDAAVESMAAMLGFMHLVGKKSSVTAEQRVKDWDKDAFLHKAAMLLENIQRKSTHDSFDRLALKSVLFKKDIVEHNQRSFRSLGLTSDHLLHGDFLDLNIFFNDQGAVSHIFDLEKAGYGPRSYELVRSMVYSLMEGDIEQRQFDQMCRYTRAYARVYPISSEELSTGLKVFYLVFAHSLWIESEHYLQGNMRVDELLEGGLRRLIFLTEHFEKMDAMLAQSLVTVSQ